VKCFVLVAALAAAFTSACGASWGGFVIGERRSAVDGYFFDYQIYGGDAVGLLQVFDDGERTYFQFRELDLRRAPSIAAEDSAGGRRPVRIEATSPYLVVPELARKFVLVFGAGKEVQEASAVRIGAAPARAGPKVESKTAPSVIQSPSKSTGEQRAQPRHARAPERREIELASASAEEEKAQPCAPWISSGGGRTINVPFGLASTEPTRQAQDDLKGVAKRLSGAGTILIRGRPSPGGGPTQAQKRAEAIRGLLVRSGVAASRITLVTETLPKGAPSPSVYYSEILYGVPSSGFVLDGC
jgi:outer membrane protein OmpA-like peptidoglycan-associated protein